MRDGNHSKLELSDRGSAKRKRAERDRMRDAGFKVMQFWVHYEDSAKVKRLVLKLRTARIDSEDE